MQYVEEIVIDHQVRLVPNHAQSLIHQFAHFSSVLGTDDARAVEVDASIEPGPVVLKCSLAKGGERAVGNSEFAFGGVGIGEVIAKNAGQRLGGG